jgi:hypothetical protein
MLHQVPVPLAFVGRTYGELVTALLLVSGGAEGATSAPAAPPQAQNAASPGFKGAPLPAPWAHEVPLGLLRRKSENRGWR